MKTLLIVLLAVVAVSARPVPVLGDGLPQEVLEFLMGFGEGMEADMGNLTDCQADEGTMLSDFEGAIKDFENGFRHFSIRELEDGFKLFGQGIEEIARILKDCGAEELVADLEKLAADLKSGGVVKFIEEEGLKIFTHGKQVTVNVKNLINAWNASPRDYHTAGFNVGEIVGYMLEPPNV